MLQKLIQAPIRWRLPALIVGALIFCISVTILISFVNYKASVEGRINEVTESIAVNSETLVENWIAELVEELTLLSADRTSVEMLRRLNFLFNVQNSATPESVREVYIEDNPFPLGQRQQFDIPQGGTFYDAVHHEFHEYYRNLVEHTGYYDLFLILPDGTVAYSVYKEDDFASNLLDGQYAGSGLGEAFRLALDSQPGEVSFVDFAPYAPSADAPASFMAQSVSDDAGNLLGVVAIQLPIELLANQLTASSLLAPEDEIYIFGADGLARTSSVEPDLLSILQVVPEMTHTSELNTNGIQRYSNVTGLRSLPVEAYVRAVDIFDNTWMIVVERDRASAFAPLRRFLRDAGMTLLLGIAASLAIGIVVARSVTRPVNDLSISIKSLVDNDYVTEITGKGRRDEFGQVGQMLETLREKLSAGQELADQDARRSEEQTVVVEILGDGLKQLADCDLSGQLEDSFPDDYEALRHNFNATLATMNELMRTIVENSQEIHTRAAEISTSSDDLSHRTEKQAATLEETAAALDELTASVREASENASEVESVVTQARKEAEDSGRIVSEAVTAMSTIRKSSSEISQIIGVIDDIAFQTNLLSLNAGVEAARAGEAGRGFAVVASEVRALAQRSSEAAKQIKTLITSSSEQVETGVGLVERTGEALGSIIDRVGNIDGLVGGIASGAREQSVGLNEINVGVSQLDQVTQQNAAMVEESTAAASALRNEAAGLTQTVARFKIKRQRCTEAEAGSVVPFTATPAIEVHELPDAKAQEVPAMRQAIDAGGWSDF